jgi:hypothetical protein
MVERTLSMREVRGSIPLFSIFFSFFFLLLCFFFFNNKAVNVPDD